MDLSQRLGTSFECECGRAHQIPVRRFLYDGSAVDSLPQIIRESCGPVRRVAVVADVRTWEVCGAKTLNALATARLDTTRIIVPDRGSRGPMCDDGTHQSLLDRLRGVRPDVVAAVGSGVINDLSKWSSFELGIPYLVVATAASMNGYSAANVAPTIAGVKMLIRARAPLAVIAEPSIIERAPREMTTAGFGDVIAKHQSNADWLVNRRLFDEYYCGFCAGIVGDIEHLYLDHPEDIRDSKPDAVKALFEALFGTGLAMTLVGTSAPASGGEHLLSHTLDMMAEVRGESHDLHGRQVGIGTLLSAALYQRVLAAENPTARDLPAAVDDNFWAVPSVVAAIKEQYNAKRQCLTPARETLGKTNEWDTLREKLSTEVKSPQVIRDWLQRAGGAVYYADIGCSRERIRAAILHMHEIRKRFSIVDLAWLAGVLPGAVDELIDEWLSENCSSTMPC